MQDEPSGQRHIVLRTPARVQVVIWFVRVEIPCLYAQADRQHDFDRGPDIYTSAKLQCAPACPSRDIVSPIHSLGAFIEQCVTPTC